MKGLELSRCYYRQVFLPACKERLPEALGHFAAGLVGEGSECFGYDDRWSQDHSFGPKLCIWLTQEDHARYGAALDDLWHGLPDTFCGYRRPAIVPNEGKRSGVFTVEEFYQRLLGVSGAPKNLGQWLSIGEPYFAAAVNGEVYSDAPGAFTAIRKQLLGYFPEDIIRYSLAQNAAIAAQTGQYNLLRSHLHGEELAANNAKARFIQSVIAMVFLLNKTYRPFYKWAPRAMRDLPILGGELHDELLTLSQTSDLREQVNLVEEICGQLIAEMRQQNYTAGNSNYLMDHLPEIMGRIESSEIKRKGLSLAF